MKLREVFNGYQEIITLDTETTGLSFEQNQIIELGVVRYKVLDDELVFVEELNELIKLPPQENLSPEIVKLTGITDEDLSKNGIFMSEAAKKLYAILTPSDEKNILFIAYNAAFDMAFVRSLFARFLVDFESLPIDFLDVLTIYKDRAEYPHKLKDAIAHYQLEDKVVNSHRASDDAKAALAVLLAMASEKNDIGRYINLFGFNPKYAPMATFQKVINRPQNANSIPLYANK
ncbi:MAG: 3'-5' exonuclease [Bacilli bacterium]|nr:3'-5' exonuclease [Bacilli bacterium]